MKYKCVNKSSCCVPFLGVDGKLVTQHYTHNSVRISQSKQTNKQTKRESKQQSCWNIVLSLYYLKKFGAWGVGGGGVH